MPPWETSRFFVAVANRRESGTSIARVTETENWPSHFWFMARMPRTRSYLTAIIWPNHSPAFRSSAANLAMAA